MTRLLAPVAIVLALALACSGPGAPSERASSTAPEKTAVKIGVGGQSQLVYLPLTLAGRLGYFRDEGLSVQIDDLRASSDAVRALLEGSVDVASGFYEQTIRAQLEGRFVEMFTTFDVCPGLVLMIGTQHQDQVRSIRDLAGHPLGVSSPGSPAEEMVKVLLKRNGMAADAVPVVAIGSGSTAVEALAGGQVWAGVTMEPAASQLERAGGVRVLYDTRTLEGTRQVFGGSWPAGGLVTTEEFVKQNPRTVRALARAAVRALRYLKATPAADIADHLPSSLGGGGDRTAVVESLKANLGLFSGDGTMPSDGPASVLETLKAVDPRTDWTAVDLARTFDDSFVRRDRS
jgi:NitT/TauT family transport system substrate-binding protein